MRFLSIFEHKTLTGLLDDAALLVRDLKAMRNPMDLLDHDALARKLQHFHASVKTKEDVLGHVRVTRILRLDVPAVRGIDRSKAIDPNLEEAILWAEVVFKNIDNELRRIESRRVLWLTFFAAFASVLAAFAAIYPLIRKS